MCEILGYIVFLAASLGFKGRLIWGLVADSTFATGAPVAFVGDSITAYWAHLTGLRIVAEVPEESLQRFSQADQGTGDSLLRALAATKRRSSDQLQAPLGGGSRLATIAPERLLCISLP